MIFYFSGTGNSKHAAEVIAAKTGDRLVSIGKAMKTGELSFLLEEGEDFGIVTPVHFRGVPDIVYEFLKKADIKGKGQEHYVYHLVTFSSATGGANSMVMSALSQRFGLMLNATYAVRMVGNYAPKGEFADAGRNGTLLQEAEAQLAEAADLIARHDAGDHNFYRGLWALLWPAAQLVYESRRRTQNFHLTDACTGCGLCESLCPCNAIRMKDRRPQWVQEKCTLCLACYHRCPESAILYGKKESVPAGVRYYHPGTDPEEG